MPSLLTNNAFSTLAGSLTNVATSFSVAAGEGARFPNPGGGQYFYCTLSNSAGTNVEIVKCTARATDAFTVVRGQDGTTGVAFNAGDLVELRPIAEMFREKLDALRGNWKMFYSDGSGAFTELALGAAGTLLQGNGVSSAPTFAVPVSNIQTFTATGGATWTKPSGGQTMARIQIWAGGGSGGKGRAASAAGGGGGGEYKEVTVALSSLGATESVSVGAGGAAQTTADLDGNVGGNTTFGSGGTLVTAYGGGPGGGTSTTGRNFGGNGGGPLAAGGLGTKDYDNAALGGGSELHIETFAAIPRFWGVSYKTLTTQNATKPALGFYSGAGGPPSDSSTGTNAAGGDSYWGGAGGGAGAENSSPGAGAGGTSVFGGNGGTGAFDANNATAGSQPGGGGGGSETGNSGAGGDGKIIVTCW